MPQINRRPKSIKGGHSKHPRWFGPVRKTMAETTKDVWMTLLENHDRLDNPGVVEIGVRRLADESGWSIGAVRNATADLEHRGLIIRLPDGPYGRSRWRMVLTEEPQNAKEKPKTRRGQHAVHQERIGGRFGRRSDTDTTAQMSTDTTAHLAADSTAHLGRLLTDSTAHDRDDTEKCASAGTSESGDQPDDDGLSVVDEDGWWVSGRPAHLGWDRTSPDYLANLKNVVVGKVTVDPYSLNPNTTREYEPGRKARVTFEEDG